MTYSIYSKSDSLGHLLHFKIKLFANLLLYIFTRSPYLYTSADCPKTKMADTFDMNKERATGNIYR